MSEQVDLLYEDPVMVVKNTTAFHLYHLKR